MTGGRGIGNLLRALVLGVMVLAAVTVSASAHDSGIFKGPRVAAGKSPYDIPWRIYAGKADGGYIFEFAFKPPAYYDAGWFAGVSKAEVDTFNFTAVSGSDLSEFPEGDLSGVAARRVLTIEVEMSDGSQIRFSPRAPRERAVERKPWLTRFRVFDVFFSDEIWPQVMTAFDRDGNLIERRRSRKGSFFPDYNRRSGASAADRGARRCGDSIKAHHTRCKTARRVVRKWRHNDYSNKTIQAGGLGWHCGFTDGTDDFNCFSNGSARVSGTIEDR